MRILSVHNEYLIKGGEDESRRAEVNTLEKYGDEVTIYTEHNSKISEISKAQAFARTIWSSESYNKVKSILKAQKHDIMHVQNTFPLISPSIYYAAKSQKVPIIQAVRNYRLRCVNAILFRDGHVCELCLRKTFPTPAIKHKCYRNNLGATVAAASMLGIHHSMHSYDLVSKFACISQFVRNKLIEAGFKQEKLVVKPNFVFPDPGVTLSKENFVVFVGRLEEEKGVSTLLKAFKLLNAGNIKLKIIGEGALAEQVKQFAAEDSRIEYLGKKPVLEVYDVIGKAKLLVIPSEWHEPFGRVVVEAFAKGTPVIGAKMGGIPELIEDGKTGYVFEAGNANNLAATMAKYFDNGTLIEEMSRNARQEYLLKYTAEINYKLMHDIYASVM